MDGWGFIHPSDVQMRYFYNINIVKLVSSPNCSFCPQRGGFLQTCQCETSEQLNFHSEQRLSTRRKSRQPADVTAARIKLEIIFKNQMKRKHIKNTSSTSADRFCSSCRGKNYWTHLWQVTCKQEVCPWNRVLVRLSAGCSWIRILLVRGQKTSEGQKETDNNNNA